MWKKIFALLIFVFLLVSCWWEEVLIEESGFKTFENSDFVMDIPKVWEVIEDEENILPKAREWEIELAVTSTNFNTGFANNMLILSTELDKLTTPKDFSMLNNIWASSDYVDYKILDTKDITFADWSDSVLYTFEAKYNKDTPRLKFLQTANICNTNKAFFITLALNLSVENTTRYEEFLTSFECK